MYREMTKIYIEVVMTCDETTILCTLKVISYEEMVGMRRGAPRRSRKVAKRSKEPLV
jgi:hypothetical protein